MHLEFDPRLVEEAVFATLKSRPPGDAVRAAWRARLDACYEATRGRHPREAEVAFRAVHADYFGRLGFEARLRGLVAEFPLVRAYVAKLVLGKALVRSQEGGDLYVRPDGMGTVRTAIIRMRAEVLVNPAVADPMVRRELARMADMVDPAFGYRPTLGVFAGDPARQDLVRDRYAVLWEARVDGRLSRSGHLVGASREALRLPFAKAFAGAGPEAAEGCLTAAWEGRIATHADLLSAATTPERWDAAVPA